MNEEPSKKEKKKQDIINSLEEKGIDIEDLWRRVDLEEKAATREKKWKRMYIYLRIYQFLCYAGMMASGVFLFKFNSDFNLSAVLAVVAGIFCFWLGVGSAHSLRISFPEKYNSKDDEPYD